MAVKPISFGPWSKGVDASTGVLSQPKGSVPRISNLLLTKRGALETCDGSGIVNAFTGIPVAGRGRAMCEFFFEPTGVAPYYLRIMKALDQPLGKPRRVIATATTGSGLPTGVTQFYKVTALDGVGGETDAVETSVTPSGGNLQVTLTWNVVPNAIAYNVYRGPVTNGEVLLVNANLPVPQPSIGTTSVSWIDNGSSTVGVNLPVTSIAVYPQLGNFTLYAVTLASPFPARRAAHLDPLRALRHN